MEHYVTPSSVLRSKNMFESSSVLATSTDHESSEKSDLNALEAFMKKHAKHVSLQDMSAFTGYLIQSACDTSKLKSLVRQHKGATKIFEGFKEFSKLSSYNPNPNPTSNPSPLTELPTSGNLMLALSFPNGWHKGKFDQIEHTFLKMKC